MPKRRKFSTSFKKQVALAALRGDKTIQELAAPHRLHPNQISQWKRQAVDGLDGVFTGKSERASRDIESDHAKLSVSKQCTAVGIARGCVYYRPKCPADELFMSYPFYGSRQMIAHLRREGTHVGRRRVLRLMRLIGLQPHPPAFLP